MERRSPPPEPAVELQPGFVDTVWTVPNLFTLLRMLCLPLFVWLLFGMRDREAAGWLLGALGATDWMDGYLARRLHQASRFGKRFDPTVDRMLFGVGLIAIMIDRSMPLWFGGAVLVREAFVATSMSIATFVFGMRKFDVTFLGKTATFLLMFAVPGFLLANSEVVYPQLFRTAAWVLGVPGLALSYYTAVAYLPIVLAAVRDGRNARSNGR